MRNSGDGLVLVSLFTVCCLIGGTFAYWIYGQFVENALTVGENSIQIMEEYDPPDQLEAGVNVFDKKVQVKNTGTVSCYVRVFAEFSDSEMKGRSEFSADGVMYYPAGTYAQNLPEHWIYIEPSADPQLGGFYYYACELEPEQSTSALFSRVKSTFGSADQIRDYEIMVYSESVQVRDCTGAEFAGEDAWRQAWTEFLERR